MKIGSDLPVQLKYPLKATKQALQETRSDSWDVTRWGKIEVAILLTTRIPAAEVVEGRVDDDEFDDLTLTEST